MWRNMACSARSLIRLKTLVWRMICDGPSAKRPWHPTLPSPRGRSPRTTERAHGSGERHLHFGRALEMAGGMQTGLPSFLAGPMLCNPRQRGTWEKGRPHPQGALLMHCGRPSKSLCLPKLQSLPGTVAVQPEKPWANSLVPRRILKDYQY